jgi:hypothetical protein
VLEAGTGEQLGQDDVPDFLVAMEQRLHDFAAERVDIALDLGRLRLEACEAEVDEYGLAGVDVNHDIGNLEILMCDAAAVDSSDGLSDVGDDGE